MSTKIWILLGAAIFIVFPIIINLLMTFGNAVTDNDWIGFFGSYIGAIIGAGVAVTVSRIQAKSATTDFLQQMKLQDQHVRERIENEIHTLKMSNRVFIGYTKDYKDLLLHDMDEDKTKILLPYDMSKLIEHNDNEFLKTIKAEFIKLEFYGSAECVLDLKIYLKRIENGEIKNDSLYLGGFNKGHNVFIPISLMNSPYHNILNKLEIEYRTVVQENIKYVSDLNNNQETYYVVDHNGEKIISQREAREGFYILPGNKTSTN